MSTASSAPTVTSPTSSSSAAPLPHMSVLLSAPTLDPYISQLDEATLAQLYNQPPPLGSSVPSASSTALYSSPAAIQSLKSIEATLAAAIDSAWKLTLHLDAGPDTTTTTSTGPSRSPLSLQSSVSVFLSSLASLDSAARQCDLMAPQWLVEQLDEGRNPERGLGELVEQFIANNDRARGRAIATHSVREAMEMYVQAAQEGERQEEAQQMQWQAKSERANAME